MASLFTSTPSAASVVPIDSSSVNVKQSGNEFSYSIHENHGVAIDPLPLVKLSPNVQQEVVKDATKDQKKSQIPGMIDLIPVGAIPTYTYLPAIPTHQPYAVPYPYGISYPSVVPIDPSSINIKQTGNELPYASQDGVLLQNPVINLGPSLMLHENEGNEGSVKLQDQKKPQMSRRMGFTYTFIPGLHPFIP